MILIPVNPKALLIIQLSNEQFGAVNNKTRDTNTVKSGRLKLKFVILYIYQGWRTAVFELFKLIFHRMFLFAIHIEVNFVAVLVTSW